MKTIIVSLNSKFIHSSLAPRYLKAYCGDEFGEIKVLEFTINDSMDSVIASIYKETADIAAFSCYIWNIEYLVKLVESLKKVSPRTKIVVGGPEVSFDAEHILSTNPYIDYIITGEGERPFKDLMSYFCGNSAGLEHIGSLWYRDSGRVLSTKPCSVIENPDTLISPYSDEMLASLGNKIVYYESSRGCPFSCSYCLSSTLEGVRYFSLDRVKADLMKLVKAGVKLIKFVDRTFNSNRERAKQIFKFIIANASDTNFHFEAAADLFDDEMIDILSNAPAGLIQFEIGVQTTNTLTLELVHRKTNLIKVFDNVKKIKNMGNIHLHLDLIAGLPAEDYASFIKSFDEVHSLQPHQLQLGFLKLLKGSNVREQALMHDYEFKSYPPYEVLYNKYISFEDMMVIKGIEDLVERYYNSGRFINTLRYIIAVIYQSPFRFYRDFLQFNTENGLSGKALSSRESYTALIRFISGEGVEGSIQIINDLLKLDYLSSDNSNNLPEGLGREMSPGFKEWCFELLKDAENIKTYLPQFENMPAKQIYKQVHFEVFNYDVSGMDENMEFKQEKNVVVFDYTNKNKVSGLYRYQRVTSWKG